VWWTNFDPQVGREQAGRRPAIVAGTAMACDLLGDLVILIPVTTKDRDLPFQPRIALDQPSVAMCDQIKSVSRERLHTLHRERITEDEIDAIRFVLRKLVNSS
jgi:mRNA interferase MazF